MPNASTPPRDPDTDLRKPAAESRKPKTGKSSTAASIKSFVRKNLLASPDFPRLYADTILHYAPNSHAAKILAPHYKKIVAYTERTKQLMSAKSCTHIKVTGVRCGSPSLRGEQFCYFHQRMLRTVRYPASRIRLAALLEDEESIQVALMETINALLLGTIEIKRAELILRALNTAVRNIRRVKFGVHKSEMVTEIPDYPTPPPEQVDEEYANELRRQEQRAARAKKEDPLIEYFGGADKIPVQLRRPTPATTPPSTAAAPHVSPTNVGTAAPGCQGGPEVPGRSAAPLPPPRTVAAKAPDRKPPLGVKEAPKERKNTAHGASRG
jgi:hypothetical protein